MEAVATHSRRLESAWDRDHLGDARYVVMERGIETRHLGQLGIETMKRLDRLDLAGEMVGVVNSDPAQRTDNLARDSHRTVELLATVNNAMPNNSDVTQADAKSEVFHEEADSGWLIGSVDLTIDFRTAIGIRHDQPRTRHTDPLDSAPQHSNRRVGRSEQRELEARRTAVDRQNERPARFLQSGACRPGGSICGSEGHDVTRSYE